MAIIDPDGLFSGERLAACSDIAQLYWPRFFLAANSCARIELSYKSLVSRVFGNFHKFPESSEIWSVFREYEANYLAVLYEVGTGSWWCQFVTSEKFLPKYKKTRDELTPPPPSGMMEAHRVGYLEWKRSKSFQNESFQKTSESFQREGVGIGVGIGIGIGVGKKQKPSAKGKPSTAQDARFGDFKKNFEAYFLEANKVPAPWDGREGKALSTWLAANPTIDLAQWRKILYWRMMSPNISQSKRLSAWIEVAIGWLRGMADDWGKPITGGNGHYVNGNGTKPSIDEQANAHLRAALRNEGIEDGPDQAGDHAPRGGDRQGPKPGNLGDLGAKPAITLNGKADWGL